MSLSRSFDPNDRQPPSVGWPSSSACPPCSRHLLPFIFRCVVEVEGRFVLLWVLWYHAQCNRFVNCAFGNTIFNLFLPSRLLHQTCQLSRNFAGLLLGLVFLQYPSPCFAGSHLQWFLHRTASHRAWGRRRPECW